MATSDRQLLTWKLQKKLPGLTFEQLQAVAKEIAEHTTTMTEPELFDVIIDFIRKLKDMEDEGMSSLLFLLDVVQNCLAGTGTTSTEEDGEEDSTLCDEPSPTHATPPAFSGDLGEGLSPPKEPTPAKSTTPAKDPVKGGRASSSVSVPDQVVRLTEVASFLLCREFKIHGGQLSDSGSKSPTTVSVNK